MRIELYNRSVHFECYLWLMAAAGCEVEEVTGVCAADVFVATLVSTFRLSGVVGCFGLFRICDRISLAYLEFELRLGSLVLYRLFSQRCNCAVGGVACCGMLCTLYDIKLAACYFRPLVVRRRVSRLVRSLCAHSVRIGGLEVGEIRGGLEGVLFEVFGLLQERRGGDLTVFGSKDGHLLCADSQ